MKRRSFAKVMLVASALLAVIAAAITMFPILVIYMAIRAYIFFGFGALLLVALVSECTGIVFSHAAHDRRGKAYLSIAAVISLVAFIVWLFWLCRLIEGGWGPA